MSANEHPDWFHFLTIVNMVSVNMESQVSLVGYAMFCVLSGPVVLLGYVLVTALVSEKPSSWFPWCMHQLIFPPAVSKGSSFLISSPAVVISFLSFSSFCLFLLSYYVCELMCPPAWHSVSMKLREQLAEVSPLLPCKYKGSALSHQTLQQEPLPAESSCWPVVLFFLWFKNMHLFYVLDTNSCLKCSCKDFLLLWSVPLSVFIHCVFSVFFSSSFNTGFYIKVFDTFD